MLDYLYNTRSCTTLLLVLYTYLLVPHTYASSTPTFLILFYHFISSLLLTLISFFHYLFIFLLFWLFLSPSSYYKFANLFHSIHILSHKKVVTLSLSLSLMFFFSFGSFLKKIFFVYLLYIDEFPCSLELYYYSLSLSLSYIYIYIFFFFFFFVWIFFLCFISLL